MVQEMLMVDSQYRGVGGVGWGEGGGQPWLLLQPPKPAWGRQPPSLAQGLWWKFAANWTFCAMLNT